MRLRPLFTALALLVLATLLEPQISLNAATLISVTLVCIALGILTLRRLPLLGVAALYLALFSMGLLRARGATMVAPGDPSYYIGQMATLAGKVEEPPEPGAFGSVHFILNTNTGKVWCQLREGPGPTSGSVIEVRGRVEAPLPATNPGQFDWKAHLARQGTHSLLKGRSWRILSHPGFLDRLLNGVRGNIQSASAHYLAPPDAALLNGLLLSARTELPVDLNDAFQRTGAVHVLSVSGLHLAALGLFLNFLLTRVLPARQGLRVTITLVVVWLFAFAAGGAPAAVRSALMLSVVLLAPLLRRDAEPLHSLAFAALIILLQNPLALFDPGTQLSFVACTGLILLIPPLEFLYFSWEPEMRRLPQLLRWLKLLLAASVIAQLATWPLVAWHFNLFSVGAPVANIPLALLSEWLLLAGLMAVPLGFVPLIGPLWWWVLAVGLKLLRWLAYGLAAPSWVAVSMASPPLWFLILYYAVFWGASLYVRKIAQRRLFAPALANTPFRLPSGSTAPAGHLP